MKTGMLRSRDTCDNDCSCCNSRAQRRAVAKGLKQREARAWKADQRDNS